MAILIRTPQQLHNVRNNLAGDYELANDIDMSGWGNFTPFGTAYNRTFRGVFDGKGYSIKNITIQNHTYTSIFGYMGDVDIKNLKVENASVESQNNYTGILFSYWNGLRSVGISNCYVDGQVNGKSFVGGIGGQILNGSVYNSISNADVTGESRVGGFIGYILSNGQVTNSYSTGKVTPTSDPLNFISGFIGNNALTDGSNIINSYWDINTSAQTTSVGGTGKTTAQMKDQSTYTGWDFDNTWVINGNYPYLQVLGDTTAKEILPKEESRTVHAHVGKVHSHLNVSIYSSRPPQSLNINVNSHVSSITSHANHIRPSVTTSRNVEGYLPPIYSNVTVSVLSSNNEVRDVSSYINALNTHVVTEIYRKPLEVTRDVTSHMGHVHTYTDVLSSLDLPIPMVAYVSVHENPSMALKIRNTSYSAYTENPSFVEVIE